jgi:hypothetical protein
VNCSVTQKSDCGYVGITKDQVHFLSDDKLLCLLLYLFASIASRKRSAVVKDTLFALSRVLTASAWRRDAVGWRSRDSLGVSSQAV